MSNSNTTTAAAVTTDIHNVGLFGVGGAGNIELQNVYHDSAVNRNLTKWGSSASHSAAPCRTPVTA